MEKLPKRSKSAKQILRLLPKASELGGWPRTKRSSSPRLQLLKDLIRLQDAFGDPDRFKQTESGARPSFSNKSELEWGFRRKNVAGEWIFVRQSALSDILKTISRVEALIEYLRSSKSLDVGHGTRAGVQVWVEIDGTVSRPRFLKIETRKMKKSIAALQSERVLS